MRRRLSTSFLAALGCVSLAAALASGRPAALGAAGDSTLAGSGAGPAPANLADAAGPTAAGTVEALVDDVLAHSPELAAAQARGAAASEEVSPAGALPDPMVELMLQDVGFPTLTVGREEMSMAGVEVTQGLLWPGKRRARAAAARAGADVSHAEVGALRRRLAAEVRGLAASLYALDREREALGSSRELLSMLAATVTARYAASQEDQEAVLKQQLEVSRLDERLTDLAAERAGVVAQINRLQGRTGDQPVPAIESLPAVAWPAGGALPAAAQAPEVLVHRAAVEEAQAKLVAAQVEKRPNALAAAGYGYRDGFDPVVTLRLGLELPLWSGRKQAPLARAAAHELDAARQDLAATLAAAAADSARLAAAWTRDEAQIRLYLESILPRTSAALDAARANYLADRADFATVAEDFRAWLEARVELARREADRFAVWAQMTALVGEDESGVARSVPPGAGKE